MPVALPSNQARRHGPVDGLTDLAAPSRTRFSRRTPLRFKPDSRSALLDHFGGALADAPGRHPRAVPAVAAGDHEPEVIRSGNDRHLRLRVRLVDPVGPGARSVVDASDQLAHGQPHLGVQELAQLTPPEPGTPNLLSMLRAERDDHGDAVAHLVEDRRAEIAHGGDPRHHDPLARGLRYPRDRIDALTGHNADTARPSGQAR